MINKHIVCAANRSGLTIVLGARHFDVIMQAQIRQLDGSCANIDWNKSEQGFITNTGLFVSRIQAWKIAEKTKQIINRCGGDNANGGTLYSENLY